MEPLCPSCLDYGDCDTCDGGKRSPFPPASPLVLLVKRLDPDAKLPTKAHDTDAGIDFYALEKHYVDCDEPSVVSTGVAVAIPPGYYLQFQGRSSLAKWGVAVLGGVVDEGYRGEVLIILARSATEGLGVPIKPGDKIAQAVLLPVPKVTIAEVSELPPGVRGDKGFGSSGA